MAPTISQSVVYHPSTDPGYEHSLLKSGEEGPFAAVVTKVVSGSRANLTVFPVGDYPQFRSNVPHKSDAEEGGNYWTDFGEQEEEAPASKSSKKSKRE